MKRYPFIEFMAQHGRRLALAISAVAVLLALVLLVMGVSLAGGMAALIGAVLLYPLMRLLAELIEVISDTLMPR
ncbi:Uncharacterised protein [Xylophilus ampelinus]|nr:hypothetical protein [Variovorax sp.]VTY35499.1 Uncharacterised protein [Xylophilus ampelinus]|tara:strand:+ start:867 stop:1088 length:222 start_codon:yes stop_codon:yes gene_type:complete